MKGTIARRVAGQSVKLGTLQIEILCLLREHHKPVVPSHTLLPSLAVRLTTLGEALKSLHQKGLIHYIPHRTDHRRKRIEISPLGRERVRRFCRHFEAIMQHEPAPRLARLPPFLRAPSETSASRCFARFIRGRHLFD